MATQEQMAFIENIAKYAAKYAPTYGIRVISPIIAQAINESGWGKSDLGQRHNYFGLKCRSNWTGASYSKVTQEEYVPGNVVNITDRFRVYPDMESGVRGYFEFLFDPIAGGMYDNLKGITDPVRYCQTIKDDGYCTRSDYVQELTKLINDYDLTRYDTVSGGGQSVPKLFIIAGHGAGDPGAMGNGYSEAERVRALAQRIYDLAPKGTVQLGDFSRNYYADKGLNTLAVDKDTMVVELHMDSADTPAKGAHVIIKGGYSPDWFDTALADGLAAYMPGRASKIVGRTDLGNANRAAARGINYRLVENGFITNPGDVAKFNDLDTLATIYLKAAGITPTTSEGEDMTPEQNAKLDAIYNEVMRTDDPTGRGNNMKDHDHIKYIAKAIQEVNSRQAETNDLLRELLKKVG